MGIPAAGLAWASLVLEDAMFGPHHLVAVNAKVVAGAGSGAGFLGRRRPLQRSNCVLDLVQLPLKMGNQCREVDLVYHERPPDSGLYFAIESEESGYGRTRDPHGAIP